MRKQILEEINLEDADPGTIRIDCSGAYIANDYLLRGSTEESSSEGSDSTTPTPTSGSSSESEDVEDDDKLEAQDTEQAAAIAQNGKANDHVIEMNFDDDDETPLDLTKNITLPKHNTEIVHISVDIGGTLTKLVYFTKSKNKINEQRGGRLHFKDFQTECFHSEALQFMVKLVQKSIQNNKVQPQLHIPITYIIATGGGAHKFYQLMTKSFKKHKLPMKIIAKDEMECLIKGLDWLITKIPNEIFTFDLSDEQTRSMTKPPCESELYPYLLVNIGSGVSMIKVTGPGPMGFERIGGSSLGGGTLWGLLSLLTDAKDYNEMLEMASRGNNDSVDLLVGDIYGTSYNKIGLKSNHIASSFAKVFKKLRFNNQITQLTPLEKLQQFKQEDIARSLLYSISNNIGQIAYLQAVRHNLKRIYFGGSYISGHKQTIHTLSYAVNFWSQGGMNSYFLRHEGYLGSVGAFMMGPNTNTSAAAAGN